MARAVCIVFSCEHGGNRVPSAFARLFHGHTDLLNSHRGYDRGSLTLARSLARRLDAPLHAATVTRLLVDLNRSSHHRGLFSEITRPLASAQKQVILRRYYEPYRQRVQQRIDAAINAGCRVLHFSVHSFVAELDGIPRNADIGLLYDPARKWERSLASRLQRMLYEHCPGLRTRRNYPYQGRADGFTTALRQRFSNADYAGIELEINQQRVDAQSREWRRSQMCLCRAIAEAVDRANPAAGNKEQPR